MSGTLSCTANFVQLAAAAPVTTTGNATGITAASATLNGTVNPEGLAATAYFQYGPDPNLGNATPGVSFGVGNNSFFPYAKTVTGLACATTYRFRAVGASAGGDYLASDNTFATASCPPATCYQLTLMANGDAPAPAASPTNSTGCPFGQFHAGDHIALTVGPVAGDVPFGWSGTDNNASTAAVNTATMPAANLLVYALYEHVCYHLSLGSTGQGSVPVATNPVASCPSGYFPWGYEVDVSGASPATDWQIGGWSGTENDAATISSNVILMPPQDSSAFVQYTLIPFQLSVAKIGNGTGTVASDVAGIDCGPLCSAFFPYSTTVTLTATADSDSTFLGFSGGTCNGGVPTITGITVCTAVFGLAPTTVPTSFYTLTPCRLLDTRNANDPNGPSINAGEYRSPVLAGNCGIPATAKAVALNVTIVNPSASGFLSVYPAVDAPPSTSTINFSQGQVRANNAVVALDPAGGVTVYCGISGAGAVDYIIDVNGYFQ